MERLGVGVSPGRATGPVFLVSEESGSAGAEARGGLAAVRDAMASAARHLDELAAAVGERSPEGADVLSAQALLAGDPAIGPAIEAGLDDGLDPALAVREAFEAQAAELESLGGDSYVGARAADVREAGRVVLAMLQGRSPARLLGLRKPSIVVAHDLSPADTLSVPRGLLLGLVTEVGGAGSHAAIVARELGLPAVLSTPRAVEAAAEARSATIDGDAGTVRFSTAAAAASAGWPGHADPVRRCWLPLLGNAGSQGAVERAAQLGARGIGLLRTELLYLGRTEAPGEEEQLELLGKACRAVAPHPIVVRTLDAGSDKALPFLRPAREPNPSLGARGVRLWLARPELARSQARALLRAHAGYPGLRVMVPMVAATVEMEAVRVLFAEQAARLEVAVPPLGMMIETPAAALGLPAFRGLVDFVSLGTNDLAQYAAAADRELRWPDELGEWNPGTLRLIAEALDGARRLAIEAGVCGELAGRPDGAVLLAGLGADSLSMAAASLAPVAGVLKRLGRDGCVAAARSALASRTAAGARQAIALALEPAPDNQ